MEPRYVLQERKAGERTWADFMERPSFTSPALRAHALRDYRSDSIGGFRFVRRTDEGDEVLDE